MYLDATALVQNFDVVVTIPSKEEKVWIFVKNMFLGLLLGAYGVVLRCRHKVNLIKNYFIDT